LLFESSAHSRQFFRHRIWQALSKSAQVIPCC
jgi:hypothetical protein